MSEVRHASFNPSWGGIHDTCREQERDGFALVRVVPVTQYEAIAVFERPAGEPPKGEQ